MEARSSKMTPTVRITGVWALSEEEGASAGVAGTFWGAGEETICGAEGAGSGWDAGTEAAGCGSGAFAG